MSDPLAAPLERVIHELTKLPGIGRKSAQRLAFHLLRVPREELERLVQALSEMGSRIRACEDCFNLSEAPRCAICADPRRDRTQICVVEESTGLLSVERGGGYRGLYHVLGGALSPLRDIGPEQLRVRELVERVRRGEIQEVILATNANVEGEATAVYVARQLRPLSVRVTRLAQGLPAGSELDFTDDLTLRHALEHRREF